MPKKNDLLQLTKKNSSYLADSPTILSKMSSRKEFIVATAWEEILMSGWTWRRTMPMWVLYLWSFFFFLRPAPPAAPAGRPRPFLATSGTTEVAASPPGDSTWAVNAGLTALGDVEGLPALLTAFLEIFGFATFEGILVLKRQTCIVLYRLIAIREWNSLMFGFSIYIKMRAQTTLAHFLAKFVEQAQN